METRQAELISELLGPIHKRWRCLSWLHADSKRVTEDAHVNGSRVRGSSTCGGGDRHLSAIGIHDTCLCRIVVHLCASLANGFPFSRLAFFSGCRGFAPLHEDILLLRVSDCVLPHGRTKWVVLLLLLFVLLFEVQLVYSWTLE